jgi:hypothetical protein
MPKRRDERERQTLPIEKLVQGNDLFHRAVDAIGMPGAATMVLLGDVLKAVGSSPDRVAIEDLGTLLPELERRLLLFAPHDVVRPAMARLRQLIVTWEG